MQSSRRARVVFWIKREKEVNGSRGILGDRSHRIRYGGNEGERGIKATNISNLSSSVKGEAVT